MPKDTDPNDRNVLIAFSGQYNPSTIGSNFFIFFRGYYVNLNDFSGEQQENFLKADPVTGSHEVAYTTWNCDPKT